MSKSGGTFSTGFSIMVANFQNFAHTLDLSFGLIHGVYQVFPYSPLSYELNPFKKWFHNRVNIVGNVVSEFHP
jgi:hypothetical protein